MDTKGKASQLSSAPHFNASVSTKILLKAKGPYEVRKVSSHSPRSLPAWGCPHADSCVGRVRLPAVTRQERLSSSWSCSTLFIKHPSNLRHARQSSSGIHSLFSFPTLISGHPSSLLRHSCGLWQESLPPPSCPTTVIRNPSSLPPHSRQKFSPFEKGG
jgi:hypothetical protein